MMIVVKLIVPFVLFGSLAVRMMLLADEGSIGMFIVLYLIYQCINLCTNTIMLYSLWWLIKTFILEKDRVSEGDEFVNILLSFILLDFAIDMPYSLGKLLWANKDWVVHLAVTVVYASDIFYMLWMAMNGILILFFLFDNYMNQLRIFTFICIVTFKETINIIVIFLSIFSYPELIELNLSQSIPIHQLHHYTNPFSNFKYSKTSFFHNFTTNSSESSSNNCFNTFMILSGWDLLNSFFSTNAINFSSTPPMYSSLLFSSQGLMFLSSTTLLDSLSQLMGNDHKSFLFCGTCFYSSSILFVISYSALFISYSWANSGRWSSTF